MNRTPVRLFAACLLSMSAALSGGCLYAAAAAAGAGAYAYVRGESRANVEGSVRTVVDAAESALSDVGMPVLEAEANDLEGTVLAETTDGKEVRVRVERLTDSSSKLRIRVGTFGDRDMSRVIYDRIVERL